MEIAETQDGIDLAVSWLRTKLTNQIDLLKRIRKKRPQKSAEVTAYIDKIISIQEKFDKLKGSLEDIRGSIMGIEGSEIGRAHV